MLSGLPALQYPPPMFRRGEPLPLTPLCKSSPRYPSVSDTRMGAAAAHAKFFRKFSTFQKGVPPLKQKTQNPTKFFPEIFHQFQNHPHNTKNHHPFSQGGTPFGSKGEIPKKNSGRIFSTFQNPTPNSPHSDSQNYLYSYKSRQYASKE